MIEQVLSFWFEEIDPKQWWKKDPGFDRLCRDRFLDLHRQAAQGELFHWRDDAPGRLAEIIILDQFSRNMFRDTPRAFAYDAIALVLAQEAVRCGADQQLDTQRRSFLYMPYMHSESARIHAEALRLITQLGNEGTLKFEIQHKEIIDRFGRYPHRNEILGRVSTIEERDFLQQPGSSF
jgi:uncharacterized protein (DUF924 family)